MVKNKASSKKQQKRGVDFKKIKRKLGRKLPPPKNATNTEIKSKAIILPEQSVASEKAGLAVSKKGLTLKELLGQTSHHNAKVRKDALMGMRDLLLKYPEELKLHRLAVIEKLRERICDDDKIVRETLYQLLKSVILPGCKEDNQGPFMSLMMAYILNAMTHLAIDVRLMAFKFFDLVIQYHPPSFSSYAEKILQSYAVILRKNHFYLEDKGKLKNVLSGLVRCLWLLPSNIREVNLSEENVPGREILHAFELDMPTESAEFSVIMNKLQDLLPVLVNCFQDFHQLIHSMPLLDALSFDCMLSILQGIDLAVRFFVHGIHKGNPESHRLHGRHEVTVWGQGISSILLKKLLAVFPLNPMHHISEKDDDRYFILNIAVTEIFLHLSEWLWPPVELLEKFLAFIEGALLGKICSETRSGKAVREKQILTLVPFIPKLISQLMGDWKTRILQAFTQTFQDCNQDSSVKLACLTAIKEMLISREDLLALDTSDSRLMDHRITWMRELPLLLIQLGDSHPSSTQVVVRLLLHLGQCSSTNSFLAFEYDNMQFSLQGFYCTLQEGNKHYGPFIKLDRESQELSVCCLYYFSRLDALLLKSLAYCCLSHELDSFVLFRIIEVLQSAYKAGHIQIADHISFFITLVSCFRVFPQSIYPAMDSDVKISNRGTFKSITNVVCWCLSQMGDNSLVFQLLERVILEQISLKPPLENACNMVRMLVVVDSKPTGLSEHSVVTLSHFLPGYLIDVAHLVPEDDDGPTGSINIQQRSYYLLPCFFLFDRSHKLLNLVLNIMGSLVTESSSSLSPGDRSCSSVINAVVSVLLWMHKDAKIQRIVSLLKTKIDHISQNISSLQSSKDHNLTTEEKNRIRRASDRLKTLTSSYPWERQTI